MAKKRKPQINWAAVVLCVSVLAAIVALAMLGEQDAVRLLVGVLIGLLTPSPLSPSFRSTSEEDQPTPSLERVEAEETEGNDYDQ